MKTKTLAEIYLKQGHLREAYDMFRDLAQEDPSDPELKDRVAELKKRLGFDQPSYFRSAPSGEERLRTLEQWLANIRKRKGRS
jgi:AraC-like DNA-binding protein